MAESAWLSNCTGMGGVGAMTLHSFFFTILVVFNKILKDDGWPVYRIGVLVQICAIMGFVAAVGFHGREAMKFPSGRSGVWRWVFARACSGSSLLTLSTAALLLGTPAGDVAVLASINTVVAAFMGFFLLGEKLRLVHFVSLAFCLLGATIVARPVFLFGGANNTPEASLWGATVGKALAAAAGCAKASIFICSRKLKDVSPHILVAVTSVTNCCAILILAMMPVIGGDGSLQPVVSDPLGAAARFLVSLLASLMSKNMLTVASQWCPAAISATVNTCGNLTFGYLAQVILFGQRPDLFSLLGAGLMLLSVAVMVLARAPPAAGNALTNANVDIDLAKDVSAENTPAAEEIPPQGPDDDAHSLGSFIAAEFAQREAVVAPMLRPRRAIASAGEDVARARTIGTTLIFPQAEA